MDFWDLTKLMFRRWYVSVPAVMLAIGATLFVATRVEPDYVATSYVQLVPPAITPKANDETKASARNPWLDLGLASLTKAGMISVQDKKIVKALKTAGYSDDFTLTQDPQLPILTFEVIGDDEVQATQTSEQLVKRFSDSVATLQDEYGAPKEQLITVRRLDLGDNVEESTSKVKRALIAVAAVGGLLAVALTVAIDAWLRRRDRKRADGAVVPAAGEPPVRPSAVVPMSEAVPVPAKVGAAHDDGDAEPERRAVGEETAKLVPTGEETIVLPSPTWQSRNNRNGSKRP
ncbi:hypothetical protein OHA21_52105 [Actinoplanes sp. NBC_00393]|uniref:EGFR-like transmembrane domain-containing protein n=1 Tax=Actinoplanes sp. NBC_00393 TaxID=2975953 RepID=UPI002E1C9EB1